ncbi:Crp/Fnr family transcriptional regulator [Oscillatoria sp. CS-180]|uniref:Crp/Fnr family transcriptional regulator n=1 Tax=Oscillatoria sp. CS-180 TaxID=3021720 RepID=UPI00232F973D|nr:Crp/Fnr family transcriptional regulator [Oscillatoria sp. CS-180]MDB9529114.1 Crp/Fnr family transcriptional regulator [Oscillatoria sp. CS-180]
MPYSPEEFEQKDINQMAQGNRLLALLPDEIYHRLAPNFTKVQLELGQVLYEPTEPMDKVYFPSRSMVSLVQVMENGATIEAAVVGSDGMVGYPVYLGGNYSASRAVVQISGWAIALSASVLKAEFNRSEALQSVLLRYTQALIAQISQNAACNRFHPVEERLARWLLQSQDALQASHLELTQDFLASMLGTRRASVTLAAGKLQQGGLIHYNRGYIHILNREALESAACECYNVVRAESTRLLDIQK